MVRQFSDVTIDCNKLEFIPSLLVSVNLNYHNEQHVKQYKIDVVIIICFYKIREICKNPEIL